MYSWPLVEYKQIPKLSCIYEITHKDTNKVYVGRTTDLRDRARKHYQELINGKHKNPKMQNIHNKYGDAWEIRLVVQGSESECIFLESSILNGVSLSDVLNCHKNSVGGSKDQVWTQEQRERHSIIMKSKPPMTQEHKDRISAALKSSPAVKAHLDSHNKLIVAKAATPEVRAKAVETRARNNGGSRDFFVESREQRTTEAKAKLFEALDWAVFNNKTRGEPIKEFGSSWGSLKKFQSEWEELNGPLNLPLRATGSRNVVRK